MFKDILYLQCVVFKIKLLTGVFCTSPVLLLITFFSVFVLLISMKVVLFCAELVILYLQLDNLVPCICTSMCFVCPVYRGRTCVHILVVDLLFGSYE